MSTPSRTLFRLQVSGLGACIDPNSPAHLYHGEQAENKTKTESCGSVGGIPARRNAGTKRPFVEAT